MENKLKAILLGAFDAKLRELEALKSIQGTNIETIDEDINLIKKLREQQANDLPLEI